jgi:hypothetical protein
MRRDSTLLASCPRDLSVDTMDYLHQIQWPAMLVTIVAAWLIASQSKHRREIGFWCFLLSNSLWIVWGWHDRAYALIVLQIALAVLNIRGAYKNEPDSNAKADR